MVNSDMDNIIVGHFETPVYSFMYADWFFKYYYIYGEQFLTKIQFCHISLLTKVLLEEKVSYYINNYWFLFQYIRVSYSKNVIISLPSP